MTFMPMLLPKGLLIAGLLLEGGKAGKGSFREGDDMLSAIRKTLQSKTPYLPGDLF